MIFSISVIWRANSTHRRAKLCACLCYEHKIPHNFNQQTLQRFQFTSTLSARRIRVCWLLQPPLVLSIQSYNVPAVAFFSSGSVGMRSTLVYTNSSSTPFLVLLFRIHWALHEPLTCNVDLVILICYMKSVLYCTDIYTVSQKPGPLPYFQIFLKKSRPILIFLVHRIDDKYPVFGTKMACDIC